MMLKLAFKIGERIHIGDDITIQLLKGEGNRLSIAIDAPRDVQIRRGALVEKQTVGPWLDIGGGEVRS